MNSEHSTRRSGLKTPASPNNEPVSQARARARRALAPVSETPALDADLLLAEILETDRAGLILAAGQSLRPDQQWRFDQLLARRCVGEPIAYIIGRKGFRNIELVVDERVLVPRPETERLVELGLAALAERPGQRTLVDVGTGSGAIALTLAEELSTERADVRIIGSDIDLDALAVAGINRERLGLEQRVELVQADLLDGIDGPVDVILANLPYLRLDQQHRSIACEPKQALYAGDDGFDAYRQLLRQARKKLETSGLLAFEIDPDQAEIARREVRAVLGVDPAIETDLAGLSRVVVVDLLHVDSR